MTKVSKIIAGASTLAVLGVAALPLAAFAVETVYTTVEVNVGAECLIGNDTATSGETLLSVSLDATTPAKIDSGSDAIGITCNQSWTLTESVANDLATPTRYLVMENATPTPGNTWTGANGFAPLGSPVTASVPPVVGDLSTWAVNTWGMAYTGTSVTSAGLAWHGPQLAASAITIAQGSATALTNVLQHFGAKTDNSVPPGKYGAVITYTLTP